MAERTREELCGSCGVRQDRERQIGELSSQVYALRAVQSWQPIKTAPRGTDAFFWIVPKSSEETWRDTSGNPIVAEFAPYLYHGKYGGWSSMTKATHWMSPLNPPC